LPRRCNGALRAHARIVAGCLAQDAYRRPSDHRTGSYIVLRIKDGFADLPVI
jgi:hypothetical protein